MQPAEEQQNVGWLMQAKMAVGRKMVPRHGLEP